MVQRGLQELAETRTRMPELYGAVISLYLVCRKRLVCSNILSTLLLLGIRHSVLLAAGVCSSHKIDVRKLLVLFNRLLACCALTCKQDRCRLKTFGAEDVTKHQRTGEVPAAEAILLLLT